MLFTDKSTNFALINHQKFGSMSITQLDRNIQERVQEWLGEHYDKDTQNTVNALIESGQYTELTDAFYKDLEFGTGGLRGIMGVGTNRVNKYTLAKATQGLSNYLKAKYPEEQIKVVIAHDNRNNSALFARLTAEVFSANGIFVYMFNELRPTPELSFAIRQLSCHSGVMLTASHNPKEYNGYKAYGSDGGQLLSPYDKMVMDEVLKIKDNTQIRFDADESLIEVLSDEIDEKYIETLKKLSLSPEAISRQKNMKIVFSPIHGTGGAIVPAVLSQFGFENLILVEEQMSYDGNFPTVVYPNPEEKEALSMALARARETDADLLMATDPDADRVGIAIKVPGKDYLLLNGNQTAALLVRYLLTRFEESGKLTGKEYIVKTIVTSYLIDRMAEAKGVECLNTLTGFKYIGEIMTLNQDKKTFIFGGEESYGYLIGDHARDKDAVVACAMIAEMAAYYKDKGMSLNDVLLDLYTTFGYYKEKLISLTKKGKSGAEEIDALMSGLRTQPPLVLGGVNVVLVKDYLNSMSIQPLTGLTAAIGLPQSNVLQFFMEDGSIISARPSGTEPKIKFYCSVNAPLTSREMFAEVSKNLDEKLNEMLGDLGVLD